MEMRRRKQAKNSCRWYMGVSNVTSSIGLWSLQKLPGQPSNALQPATSGEKETLNRPFQPFRIVAFANKSAPYETFQRLYFSLFTLAI